MDEGEIIKHLEDAPNGSILVVGSNGVGTARKNGSTWLLTYADSVRFVTTSFDIAADLTDFGYRYWWVY